MRSWRWGLLCLGFLLSGCNTVPPGEQNPVAYDWGPFAASWTDVHGNDRQRVLGPIYDRTVTPTHWKARAVRPLYHSWNQEDLEVRRSEIVWPLGAYRHRENASYWRFLLTYRWNWDRTDPESRHRFWLFPLVFAGRSLEGEDYFALFPLGGTIREFLFWDRIRFALFPLWINSRIQEIEANTFLWPIFSRTEGPGVRRFRIFPLYGYNEREGRGRKTFILWPFYSQVRYTLPGASGFGWILFPITGHLKLEDQETWWFLPPVFRFSKGEGQDRVLGPWPVFQQEKGEDRDKFYLWPLYGRKKIGGVNKQFFLWPLGHYEHLEGPEGTTTRTGFFPFYRRYVREPSPALEGDVPDSAYTKIWPLFSHLSKSEGTIRKTVFPDLNPLRDGPIERNYGPFWQLYVRQQVQENVDTEILWGLYRGVRRGEGYQYRSLFPLSSWSRTEQGGHVSLLKGLFSRVNDGGKKRWRVLYLFHFGDKE